MAFKQQLAVIDDPAHEKAIWCTRRAAKSFTDGLYAFHDALKYPGCNVLYVGLTRDSAKGIIWKDVFAKINRDLGLGARPNLKELTWTLPNGSLIQVTGIDADEDEMVKVLGRKYRLVLVDEASLYTVNLRRFAYDIIGPALADEDGSIVLSGTSSDLKRGLFFDITTGVEPGWSLHTWTAHDNPHMTAKWQKTLDRIAKERPLYMQTPQYRQWYLNEWVVDDTKLVYRFNEQRNTFVDLPRYAPGGWTFNLSVDLGWEDDNAFILTGYHQDDPTLYVIQSYNQPKMTFDQVKAKIEEMSSIPGYPVSQVIIDGANKQGVESMRMRSDINFVYADKQDKATFIEILNADLIQAKVKIHVSLKSLQEELKALIWLTEGDKIKYPKKEHPGLSNHLCDAFLYGWRNGYHFLSKEPTKTPLPGTPEYIKQQEDLHKQAIAERIQKEHQIKQGLGWQKTKDGRDPWHEW